MALSGFLFISWRIFEIIITVPIVGMLAWFVHQFVRANAITPDDILVLFIVSVLALAWTFFTLISYLRARHDAIFVALVDLAFVGAFIGGVVVLRYIADADCSSSDAGYTSTGFWLNFNINKQCAMRKAAFALGIIDILAFFVTFLLALLVHRNHRKDGEVSVKRTSHNSRHGHRRSHSRDYHSGYDGGRRGSGRSHHSSSRRNYYV